LNESTDGLKGLSDLPTLHKDAETESHHKPPQKRRRFSFESINDLLFWAMQICILAIGLAIVWARIEATNQVVVQLLKAQDQEISIARKQADDAHEQALAARAAEHQRAIQLSTTTQVLQGVLERVSKVQDDITATLAQIRAINESVLGVSKSVLEVAEATKTASVQAASTAQSAASAAAAAHRAAGSAASNSSATRALVRSKVATAADKVRILQEEAQLTAKQRQLSKTIRQVKKKGPTIWQQLFH
jgi:transglutaminase/protease-like cytokinesis protein 3